MYKIIRPFFNLANANLLAASRFFLPSENAEQNKAAELWRATMENQARFANEYTQSLLGLLEQSRRLMTGQMETLSRRTEDVATQLAHTSVRALAIATQARREKRDRRVFPLPLPGGRRGTTGGDRRLSLAAGQQARI